MGKFANVRTSEMAKILFLTMLTFVAWLFWEFIENQFAQIRTDPLC